MGHRQVLDMVTTFIDVTVELTSYRSGCKVLCKVIGYANAKERKAIIKAMKGHVADAFFHPEAYITVAKLLSSVDDTVLLQKSFLNEIISKTDAKTKTKLGDMNVFDVNVLPPLLEVC